MYWLVKLLLLIYAFSSSIVFAGKKDILIIESYHSGNPWTRNYVNAISSQFKEYTIQTFQMDTKRLPLETYSARSDIAWKVIQAINPSLIFLGDDNALKYLAKRLGKTKYPVVYLGINSNPRRTEVYKYKNITGVLERPLLKRSIISIKKILPSINKVLILFDESTTSRHTIRDFFQGKTVQMIGNVEVHLLISNKFEL